MKPLPSPAVLTAFSLALGLAALTGFIDAYTFLQFNGLFVSFISGSTVELGSKLAQPAAGSWHQAALVISLFASGVVLGTLITNRVGSRWSPSVLLGLLAGLLALPHYHAPLTLGCLTLGMGLLNAGVHRIGSLALTPTFFTGALVRFCTGVANLLSGLPVGKNWLWHLGLWLLFLAGALAGTVAVTQLASTALLLAAGASVVLLGLALVARGVR